MMNQLASNPLGVESQIASKIFSGQETWKSIGFDREKRVRNQMKYLKRCRRDFPSVRERI